MHVVRVRYKKKQNETHQDIGILALPIYLHVK